LSVFFASVRAADIQVEDHGTIFLFRTLTDAVREWVADNVQLEAYQRWGRYGFVVEHRYAGDIVEGIQADGLTVE
jgi:hypothetical protein